MAKKTFLVLSLGISALLPLPAYADAGTPLMWATIFHLFLGNIFLGIVEGLLIAFLFKLPKPFSIYTMVAANYLSAIGGLILLPELAPRLGERFLAEEPLNHGAQFLLAMAGVAYLATLVLEWPFCFYLVRKLRRPLLKATATTFLVQTATYAGLLFWYMEAGSVTLYSRLDVVPISQITPSVPASILFISPEDGDVYKIRLNGTGRSKVVDQSPLEKTDRRFPRLLIKQTSERLDLYLAPTWEEEEHRLILSDLPGWATPSHSESHKLFQSTDLRREGKVKWNVWTARDWAGEGLHAVYRETKEWLWFALETPYLEWFPSCASILPGEFVVFQLGDQIVLLDLNAKKIAFIAMGWGPVVVLDEVPEGGGK